MSLTPVLCVGLEQLGFNLNVDGVGDPEDSERRSRVTDWVTDPGWGEANRYSLLKIGDLHFFFIFENHIFHFRSSKKIKEQDRNAKRIKQHSFSDPLKIRPRSAKKRQQSSRRPAARPVLGPGEEVGGGVNPSSEGCWKGRTSKPARPEGWLKYYY